MNAERVRELFYYEPETGYLRWRAWHGGGVGAGSRAGSKSSRGYISVTVGGRFYQAHRLIWAVVHGCWPSGVIDHINGDKTDNRLCNLRDVSKSVNGQNRTVATGVTGLIGVTRRSTPGRYSAQIRVDGKHHHLGTFPTAEAAHAAYLAAKSELHQGFVAERFAKHGG